MPTLAAAKQALGYAASPYLVPLRADLATASLTVPGLADSVVQPAMVAAGLFACGVAPADPLAPSQDDLDALPAADWPKFLAFGELHALEMAVSALAAMPESLQYGGNEHRVEWDRSALFKLLELRRKACAAKYPDVLATPRPMTAAWLLVGGDAPSSEY